MRIVGFVLYFAGITGILIIDVWSSLWLATTHGIGWALGAWITFVPLLVIPFLAGLGIPYVVCTAAAFIGYTVNE